MSVIGRVLLNNVRTVRLLPLVSQTRPSSFKSSPFLVDLDGHNVKYEKTQVPEDWKYVVRILPIALVPQPIAKDTYSSGWKPQGDIKDQPFCVERTKNHMLPVYLQVSRLGIRRITHVRHIRGDIWSLHDQLEKFLQKEQVRPIRSQVNELIGRILFYGDHVNAIKYWLTQRNF